MEQIGSIILRNARN